MSFGNGGTLPYLFSAQACAPLRSLGWVASPASEFFDSFDTLPSRGTFVFPRAASDDALSFDRTEFSNATAGALASSMAVVFESLDRVIGSQGDSSALPFAGSFWKVLNYDRFRGRHRSLQSVMLDGPLGKVIDLRRDHRKGPYRIEIGWARAGVSVFQNLILSQGRAGLQWELGLFMEFKECALLSLRDYFKLGCCDVQELVMWFAEALRPLGGRSRAQLQAGEQISLEMAMPPGVTFPPIDSRLEQIWNFGETLVHYQSSPIPGNGRPS